jgi:peptidoglycan/xylan/chitin deacetylase (PgdA/CDA1 family)
MPMFRVPRVVRKVFSNYRWDVAGSENVYLTFDDGPNPESTEWILNQLDQFGQKATFFCVGENMLTYPELGLLIRNGGHAVANHTMHHENGWRTSSTEYITSVMSAIPLTSEQFRPPYGKLNPIQYNRIKDKVDIIMWSWMSYDFDDRIPIDKIIKSASRSIEAGDILVFHDNRKSFGRLQQILPAVLTMLQHKGLKSAVLPASNSF